MAMHEYALARDAFTKGLVLDPSNKDLATHAQEAARQADYDLACRHRLTKLQQRDLVFKLRAVSHLCFSYAGIVVALTIPTASV